MFKLCCNCSRAYQESYMKLKNRRNRIKGYLFIIELENDHINFKKLGLLEISVLMKFLRTSINLWLNQNQIVFDEAIEVAVSPGALVRLLLVAVDTLEDISSESILIAISSQLFDYAISNKSTVITPDSDLLAGATDVATDDFLVRILELLDLFNEVCRNAQLLDAWKAGLSQFCRTASCPFGTSLDICKKMLSPLKTIFWINCEMLTYKCNDGSENHKEFHLVRIFDVIREVRSLDKNWYCLSATCAFL